MKARWHMRLAAFVLSLIAGSTLGLTPANAGSVNGVGGIPILYAVPANGTANQAHVCKVIGTDKYGNQAVVCVNLTVLVNGGPGTPLPYGVTAQAVLYCQNSSNAKVQCANIGERVQLADAASGVDFTENNICGHTNLACPVAGLSAQTGMMSYTSITPACESDPNSGYDDWALVVGGVTVIELPGSDQNVTLDSSNANDGSNFSSGHHYACYS
jgi:hypothetical protein